MKFSKDTVFNFTVEQTDKFTWFINFVTSHQSWSPTHCDIWIPPLFQSAHQTNPDISSESSLEKAIYTFIIPTESVYISKTLSPTSPRFKRQQRGYLTPRTGSIVANYLYSTFGFGLESLKLLHVRLSSSAEAVPVVPKSRLKPKPERAFAVRAPRLWDELPEEIRLSGSAKSFNSY